MCLEFVLSLAPQTQPPSPKGPKSIDDWTDTQHLHHHRWTYHRWTHLQAIAVFRFPTMFPPNPSSLIPAMARTRLRKSVPTHTRISAIRQQRQSQIHSVASGEKRHFSRVTWLGYPRKDSQDRESMNTDATEYSKSSTDDEAARQDEAAYDPGLTDPGAQKKKASENSGVSSHFESETKFGPL